MPWIATPPGVEDVYPGNAVEPLVDDELWAPLRDAIRGARRSLDLSQLLFEPSFAPGGTPLADEIARAAARGVRVRLLVNRNMLIPDSYRELASHFDGTGVDVARLMVGSGVMHAKLLVADEAEAFLVDAPYEQKYADTSAHAFDGDHRAREKPFHSVSARIAGPAVARVVDVFERLWERAHGAAPDAWTRPRRKLPPAGEQSVQMLCTAPGGMLAPQEHAGVLQGYLRAIERARRLLYVETQYFTSATIADAIRRALDRRPELEAIVVVNLHMDVPGYDAWQRRRLMELGAPAHPRVGVFSLWSPRRARSDPAIRSVYVHSKVAIVDDAWATIGSANLDGISLETADEFVVPVERNVEINAALLDGVDGAPATGAVAALRRRLWAEHLGDEVAWQARPPAGGWLSAWRRVARENLRRFESGRTDLLGRVLPHEAMMRPPMRRDA